MVGSLLVACLVPILSPTPVLRSDSLPPASPNFAEMRIYVRHAGGPLVLEGHVPIREWIDDDGIYHRAIPFLDFEVPLQRYLDIENEIVGIALKGWDPTLGESIDFTNEVSVDFACICRAPGPCS